MCVHRSPLHDMFDSWPVCAWILGAGLNPVHWFGFFYKLSLSLWITYRKSLKESGARKMVTNTFMPNLTMLKYIKRRLFWYIYCLGSPGIYGLCDRLKAPPVFYNTSKNRTSGELTDLLCNEMSHLLIFWQYYGFNWWNTYMYWWINTY